MVGYSIPTGKILDTFGVQFNGADLSLPTGRDCRYNHCYQSADLYETVYLPVEESGEQTLTFTYTVTGDAVQKTNNGTYTYGYVRGVSVLSYLNEGKQLDTSLVKEGDKLYYMSIGDEQYVLGERLVYTAISATEETEEKPDVVENPITMDAIFLFCLVVFMILLFFRYITAKMKFMR